MVEGEGKRGRKGQMSAAGVGWLELHLIRAVMGSNLCFRGSLGLLGGEEGGREQECGSRETSWTTVVQVRDDSGVLRAEMDRSGGIQNIFWW